MASVRSSICESSEEYRLNAQHAGGRNKADAMMPQSFRRLVARLADLFPESSHVVLEGLL
jgi:hypothetical protein